MRALLLLLLLASALAPARTCGTISNAAGKKMSIPCPKRPLVRAPAPAVPGGSASPPGYSVSLHSPASRRKRFPRGIPHYDPEKFIGWNRSASLRTARLKRFGFVKRFAGAGLI